ncbi:hypothetical protein M413DRAFT_280953 [Hebeloma cylindrosporum]|uniref:Uncharacterized protein n=1 Tax=Hebeloma cylindrosporum TaxID=76867 RepID=A0A0C2Y7P9_HEBCY|nr:hypothetical protein M413DRAFT_280953 [Hebeloma cylindrosporum h7]
MQAWKLPAELKKPHSAEQVIPAPPPDIKYLIFGSGGHLRVNDWYSASENLLVDHLARDHLRRTIFSHNIKGEPVAGTTGTWKAEHRIDYISHPQYRLCEDRLVCAYSGMQHTRAFVIPQIPAVAHSLPSPVPSSSPTAASLDLAISQPTFKASFDPISGRMCCLTTHDTAKLVIYDFLKQPL